MSEDEAYGPESEVWNHLHSGLDLATMELDALEPESRALVDEVGMRIADARTRFVLGSDQRKWSEVFDAMLRDPWFRHSAEIQFGYECISRASEALERFVSLRPVFTDYQLADKPSQYLHQVIQTYLYGFDAAAIALSGAFVEQVLRELCVSRGIYTEARLRRERPSGHTLLENAKREKILRGAYDPAKRTLDQRNRVMHRHIWEAKVIKGVSQKCIEDLREVLVELGGPANA